MLDIKATGELDYLAKFVFKLSDEDLHFYKECVGCTRLSGRCDVIRSLIENNCPDNIDFRDMIQYVAALLNIEENKAAFYVERALYNDTEKGRAYPASYRFVEQYLRAQGKDDKEILLTLATVYGDTLDKAAQVLKDSKHPISEEDLESIRLQLYSCKRVKW